MLSGFRFGHIFYPGSTAEGRIRYEEAAAQLIPLTLVFAGRSPCVVEADADLKVAARRLAIGKFTNTGQTCIAPDYVLVHRQVKQQFIEHLVVAIEQMYSRDPLSSYDYGRIINEKQFDRLTSYLQH